jgi:hypothetical protein
MAAIPGHGYYTTTEPYRRERSTCTCCIYGTCTASNVGTVVWKKEKPLTLKEKRQETMKYFKSFKRR